MPYIDDEQLASLYKEIETLSEEKLETENELTDVETDLKRLKKESRLITILLTIFAVAASVAALYFFSKTKGNNVDIAEIKRNEANRILDSIAEYSSSEPQETDEDLNNFENNSGDLESNIANIKSNVSNQTVYSVQVGAFEERSLPTLSSSILSGNASRINDFYKYSIGLFSTVEEARKFRKELVKLGFEDAFVASYLNGKRQRIENP